MVKKLTFLSINPTWWKLAFKSAVLSFILFFSFRSGFSFFWMAIFFTLAIYFYFTSCLDRKIIRSSFWLVLFLGILTSYQLLIANYPSSITNYHLLFTIYYLLITVVLFALANFLFKNQQFVYNILNFLLVFWLNALIFFKIGSLSVWSLILPIAVFFLAKEAFLANKVAWSKRTTVASAVLGFLIFEMAFFLGFLPIGFLNSALIITFFYLILRDVLIAHFSGFFHLKLLFEELSIFIAVFLAVLAATKWAI